MPTHDLGFLSMVSGKANELLEHEQRALELFAEAGLEEGVIRARQGIVLALFLGGDYGQARELQEANLEAFRLGGSSYQIADGWILLSAIHLPPRRPDRGLAADGGRAPLLAASDGRLVVPARSRGWPRSSSSNMAIPSSGGGSPARRPNSFA